LGRNFGLQYSRPWGDSAVAFVRGGYEGRVWWVAGSSTDADSNLGLDGVSLSLGICRCMTRGTSATNARNSFAPRAGYLGA
jgi:hypothetical protein